MRLRLAFFLRFTRRGCAGAAGFSSAGFGSAPSLLSAATSFGGVREERFGAGGGFFGTSLRVTSPWPTVHRFVVTQ